MPLAWIRLVNVTGICALYTTAVRGDPEIVKPAGLATDTNTSSPSATDISEIARLLVVPEPVNTPLVAPVSVMSLADRDTGSALNDSVREVVVTETSVKALTPCDPPTCTTFVKLTGVDALYTTAVLGDPVIA